MENEIVCHMHGILRFYCLNLSIGMLQTILEKNSACIIYHILMIISKEKRAMNKFNIFFFSSETDQTQSISFLIANRLRLHFLKTPNFLAANCFNHYIKRAFPCSQRNCISSFLFNKELKP